jgi:hypothetical protein
MGSGLSQGIELPQGQVQPLEGSLGADFGVENILMTSDGQGLCGRRIDAARERSTKIKTALQRRGTQAAKRHPKRLSGRGAGFKRHVDPLIFKRIAPVAEDTRRAIGIEDLKGLRAIERLHRIEGKAAGRFAEGRQSWAHLPGMQPLRAGWPWEPKIPDRIFLPSMRFLPPRGS